MREQSWKNICAFPPPPPPTPHMPTIPSVTIFQGFYLWRQPLFPSKFVTPNTETPCTRNMWLAKPREARAGWTVDFYLGCTSCDIPICGSSAPLFLPDSTVFAKPSDVVFALWFPDVSFFAARAESEAAFHVVQEFRCLISLGESVLSTWGAYSPILDSLWKGSQVGYNGRRKIMSWAQSGADHAWLARLLIFLFANIPLRSLFAGHILDFLFKIL